MKKLIKISCILLVILWLCEARKRTSDKQRQGRIFSLFNIVTFKNDDCTSTESQSSGSTEFKNGTCFTNSECTSKNGTAKGQCASGFGVCCVFTQSTAGGEINQNNTYIQNPGFPSGYTDTTDVSYKINKCQDDICQLRLDFEYFNINGPADTVESAGGICVDQFTVQDVGESFATGQEIPTICGVNTGQHMYIDIGPGSTDMVTLDFAFDVMNFLGTTGTGERKWEIKVSQIPCPRIFKAEDGCLQYSTDLKGQFKTFNYDATDDIHLRNQKYTWCVRQQPGYCCIRWSVCAADSDPADGGFSLDTSGGALPGATVVDAMCTDATDYIEIQGVTKQCREGGDNESVASKICGNLFGFDGTMMANVNSHADVCDCVAPFHITIVTNAFSDANTNVDMPGANIAANGLSRGACLEYEQIPCQN